MVTKKKKDESLPVWVIVIIILLVIFFVVAFILSFGTVNPGKISKAPKEVKDSKEEAKMRHKLLLEKIEQQEALKAKLDKKFRWIYFLVRTGFVVLWTSYLFVLVLFNLVENLGDALNYSEALILILITLNFLTFGTLSNLENFIEILKIRIENWVYGKYINLESEIIINRNSLVELETKLNL